MANDQGVVLVVHVNFSWHFVVEHALEIAVARVRSGPPKPMEDSAGERIYHKHGPAKRVEEDVVGCLFANAVYGQQIASQVSGRMFAHASQVVLVTVAEEFAKGPEPFCLYPEEP